LAQALHSGLQLNTQVDSQIEHGHLHLKWFDEPILSFRGNDNNQQTNWQSVDVAMYPGRLQQKIP